MKKKVIFGVIIIAVIIILLVAFSGNGGKVEFKTVNIEKGDIESLISTTGTINPVDEVSVGSQVSGNIAKMNVDYNSVVKAGELIAEIDPEIYKARLAEAKANLLRGQVALKQAEISLKRGKELHKQTYLSDSDLEDLEFAVESAQASLEQIKANYDLAVTNLKNCKIFSPINGVVISRQVQVGQTVAASFTAPTLFVIAKDLTKMQIEVNIDEADIGRIKEGQQVKFDVDAYPEETFWGHIEQVRLEPITVSNVVTYTVIVGVSNPELKLKPGMTANVNVIEAEAKDVLKVPAAALRLKISDEIVTKYAVSAPDSKNEKEKQTEASSSQPQGLVPPADLPGGTFDKNKVKAFLKTKGIELNPQFTPRRLWILRTDGKIEQKRMLLGISDGDFYQVVKGDLKVGDKIITDILVDGKPLVEAETKGGFPMMGMRGR
jgi:HlyD family secretion protein